MIKYFSTFFLFLTLSVNTFSQTNRFGINDMHGAVIPSDIEIYNVDSVAVNLTQIINKPTLLAFVYYRCPGICSKVLSNIAELINKTTLVAGKDYQVIAISIHSGEKPSMAKAKRRNYIKMLKNPEFAAGWNFFTADSTTIARLTNITGFMFEKRGDDIVHPTALIMITPHGKISQYLYGNFYLPADLEIAVRDANNENVDVSRVKDVKYCFAKEHPIAKSTMEFIGFTGVIIAVAIFSIVIFLIYRIKVWQKKQLVAKK